MKWHTPRLGADWTRRLSLVLGGCCGAVALLLFGYVALFSLTETCVFDPAEPWNEVVLYQRSSPLPGLLLTAAYGAVAWLLGRLPAPRWKWFDTAVILFTAVAVTAVGLWWIFLVQSMPAADSGTVFDAAQAVAAGDYAAFHGADNDFYGGLSYFQIYPFQLGYVFLSELVYRLTGSATAMPMQVVNVLALAATYVALLLLAKRLFQSRWAVTLCALLLLGCLQPVFLCSFTYGNILGFAAGVWAGYLTVRYMHSDSQKRYFLLIPLCLILALAVLSKYNNMIWAIAVAIGLVLDALHRRRWLSLAAVPAVVLLPLLAQNLVVLHYEQRSGVDIGPGISQVVYLNDGLQESWMAPGWYSDTGKSLFVNNGGDAAATDKQALEGIRERLQTMRKDPAYAADFFSKKLLSQWNEPSYECLWVSQMKGHYYGEVPAGSLLDSVYNGVAGRRLAGWFNGYQSAVLLLCCLGIAVLLRQGLHPALACLLAVPVGGGLYHLLFEAKSQYCLTYFILLVFFAAAGLCRLTQRKEHTNP